MEKIYKSELINNCENTRTCYTITNKEKIKKHINTYLKQKYISLSI